jgi:hypothetical protein
MKYACDAKRRNENRRFSTFIQIAPKTVSCQCLIPDPLFPIPNPYSPISNPQPLAPIFTESPDEHAHLHG